MKNMLLMKIKYCWPSRESEKCWFLGVAVLVLGIGHIGIHLMHKKEIGQWSFNSDGESPAYRRGVETNLTQWSVDIAELRKGRHTSVSPSSRAIRDRDWNRWRIDRGNIRTMNKLILSYLAYINIASFILFGLDKWKAVHDQRRVREAVLFGFWWDDFQKPFTFLRWLDYGDVVITL